MRFGAAARALSDLRRITGSYLGDEQARAALRRAAMGGDSANRYRADEFERASAAARSFAGLTPTSLALAGLRTSTAQPARLNLVVNHIDPQRFFAGAHTAITAAAALAQALERPLRVVLLETPKGASSASTVNRFLAELLADPTVTVVGRDELDHATFSSDDAWMATHSRTAHALQVAGVDGGIPANRVVYLIQDYEPGFSPWSTESVVAAATYHAGFTPLVNSTPLAAYLRKREHVHIDDSRVFAPSFDLEGLRGVARERSPGEVVRVLFYARPAKPRNLFELGVSALRETARQLPPGTRVEFVSAGERHRRIEFERGQRLTSLGALTRQNYFHELARSQVVLALQNSPHPSHPPFDGAISGALAVTNEFDGTRAGLHPRLLVAPADTESLALTLVGAIELARHAAEQSYLPVAEGVLGHTLESAVLSAASVLRA